LISLRAQRAYFVAVSLEEELTTLFQIFPGPSFMPGAFAPRREEGLHVILLKPNGWRAAKDKDQVDHGFWC
jgi:hypothetical protein